MSRQQAPPLRSPIPLAVLLGAGFAVWLGLLVCGDQDAAAETAHAGAIGWQPANQDTNNPDETFPVQAPGDAKADQREWKRGPFQADARLPYAIQLPGVEKWSLHTYAEHGNPNSPLRSSISGDGKRIAIIRGVLLCIYELATRKLVEVRACQAAGAEYVDVAWQPNGQYLAVARSDDVILMLPMVAGLAPREFNAMPGELSLLHWSPNSRYLAVCSDKNVRVISADGFEELRGPTHASRLRDLAWRQDGLALLSLSPEALFQWEFRDASFTRLSNLKRLACVAYAPDASQIVVYSQDKLGINAIVSTEGEVLRTWQETSTHGPQDLFWNPETGHIQTTGDRSTVTAWNQASEVANTYTAPLSQYPRSYWSSDGSIVVFEGQSGGIDTLNLTTGVTTRLQSPRIASMEFSPDGSQIALGAQEGEIWLFSADWKHQKTLRSTFGEAIRLSFSPDGSSLAVFPVNRQAFEIWSVEGTLLRSFDGEGGSTTHFAWAPDGKHLATIGDSERQQVHVWDLDGNLPHQIHHDEPIQALAWAPNRLLASQNSAGGIKIFDTETDVIQNISGASTGSLAWRPGTDQLLIGNTHAWTVGDMVVKELQNQSPAQRQKRSVARWSPSGNRLLWNYAGAPWVSQLQGDEFLPELVDSRQQLTDIPAASLANARWSHDEQLLYFLNNGDLQVYDVESQQLQAVVVALLNGEMLSLSPTGQFLSGQAEDFDGELFYHIKWSDGTRSVLHPSEFVQRFNLPQ